MPTGPSDLGWQEIHVGIALVVITTLAMGLRFAARFVRKTRLEVDDWLAVTSWIFIVAMLIELILCMCPPPATGEHGELTQHRGDDRR
jgi:hypothetical protein